MTLRLRYRTLKLRAVLGLAGDASAGRAEQGGVITPGLP